MEIVLLIIGLIIGCVLCYFVLQPKIKIANRRNEEIDRENNALKICNKDLSSQRLTLQNQVSKLTVMAENLLVKKQELMEDITALQQQAETSTQAIYDTSYQLMQEQFAQAAEQLATEYQELEEKYKNDYTKAMEESGTELAETLAQKLTELANVKTELAELRAKADAAIEAAKREEEMKRNPEDYCIRLSAADRVDIGRMIEFSKTLNNPRALLMCVWTNFIRTPLNTLCNNIFGNNEICGIYRLTINGQFYIGQSVHCKERISEHFKKALGIDMPTTSKLYNYLNKHNVWDIQVELLEKCKPHELNDRERFFIELLSANKSLNSTGGNRG